MNIEVATDMDELNEILKDPYIWEQASEDNLDPDTFYPSMSDSSFWVIAKSEEICGIILVVMGSSVSIEIHPYVLEDHKGKGVFIMKAFLDWYLESTTETANKINAKIPTFNKAGYKTALKLGFKEEGIDRQSYMRNGELFDQYLLGITRDELKEAIKWAA